MADTAESHTELFFCKRCEKETEWLSDQKICKVCRLSSRWNDILQKIDLPFDQIERAIKGLTAVLTAIGLLAGAIYALPKLLPKKADTQDSVIIDPCGRKGECLTLQLQNDGTEADMLLAIKLSYKVIDNKGTAIVDNAPIDSFLPSEAALLQPNAALIPANGKWKQTIEWDGFTYLADPAYDVEGSTCHYSVTIDTRQRSDIVGNVPCW